MGPKNSAIELKDVCYSAGRSFEIRDPRSACRRAMLDPTAYVDPESYPEL